jgi:hypothetical protein
MKYKNFFYFIKTNFEERRFLKIMNQNTSVLDYGCGEGVWSSSVVKKVYLYDKNKKLIPFLKKKYRKNNFYILKKPIFNKEIFLSNSVIQYINDKNLYSLKKKIINKFNIIIFSDIPKYPRIIEGFISIIFNPQRLMLALYYFFNHEYRKLGFYYRSLDKIVSLLDKYYNFQVIENLTAEKITRYTIVFKKK